MTLPDAARARLAAAPRRARHQTHVDWRRHIARQWAFGRIAAELSDPRLDTDHRVPNTSDAA